MAAETTHVVTEFSGTATTINGKRVRVGTELTEAEAASLTAKSDRRTVKVEKKSASKSTTKKK